WLRVRIEADPDRYLLGKEPKSRSELAEALAGALRADPRLRVLVPAPETLPYSRVRQALEVVAAAGVTTIRLAPHPLEPCCPLTPRAARPSPRTLPGCAAGPRRPGPRSPCHESRRIRPGG